MIKVSWGNRRILRLGTESIDWAQGAGHRAQGKGRRLRNEVTKSRLCGSAGRFKV